MQNKFYFRATKFIVHKRKLQFLIGGITILFLASCSAPSLNEKPNDHNARAISVEVSKTLFTDRLKVQLETGTYLTKQATTEYTTATTKSKIEALTTDYVSVPEGYSLASVAPAFRAPNNSILVPQKTSNEYSLTSHHIDVSYAIVHKEKFELWMSLGVAQNQYKLDAQLVGPVDVYTNVRPTSTSVHEPVKYVLQDTQYRDISFGENISEVAPYISVEPVYKINSQLSVSVRLSTSASTSQSSKLAVWDGMARFTYTPKDFFDIYLGYKLTQVSNQNYDREKEPYFIRDVNLSGAVGGASLRF